MLKEPTITLKEDEQGFYYVYRSFVGFNTSNRLKSVDYESAINEIISIEGCDRSEIEVKLEE